MQTTPYELNLVHKSITKSNLNTPENEYLYLYKFELQMITLKICMDIIQLNVYVSLPYTEK